MRYFRAGREGRQEWTDRDCRGSCRSVFLILRSSVWWKNYPVFYFDFNGQNYEKIYALDDFPDEQMTRWEVKYEIDKTLKGH